MYPSDYGYATSGGATKNREACLANELSNWNNSSLSDCKNNDWLYNSNNYQWTLSIYSSTPASAFVVCKNGYLASYGASYSYAFRPIVFLKSDIEITGGTGTESDPYQLSL